MISILIPTYNYKIVALVSEVHKQFSEIKAAFEIRVYEDGSSHFLEENTNIQELKNVVYKQFSENKGRTATRNLLANDASYDWLLFLDADVLPKNSDFIATYLKAVEINDDPVIFGGITYVLEAPEKSKRLRWVYGKEREAKFPSEPNNLNTAIFIYLFYFLFFEPLGLPLLLGAGFLAFDFGFLPST